MSLNELKLLGQIEDGSQKLGSEQVSITVDEEPRGNYLGMSGLGKDSCTLWYDYHSPIFNEPVVLGSNKTRIFRLGKIIEEELIQSITEGGGIVTGRQDKFIDFDGRLQGHCDGILDYTHVLECKSTSRDFEAYRSGRLQDINPSYYDQIQLYMYYSSLGRAMEVFYNKINSQIAAKEVLFDKTRVNYLRLKAYYILESKHPFHIPKSFRVDCNSCEWLDICKDLPTIESL